MTDQLSVKVSASIPSGATAVATFAYSDRLTKIPGVKKAAADRAGFKGKPGTSMTLNDGERQSVVLGLGKSGQVGADELRKATASFIRGVSKHRRVGIDLTGVDEIGAEDGLDAERAAAVVAQAAILAGYAFSELKSDEDAAPSLNTLTIAVHGDLRAIRSAVAEAAAVADGVCFARDMVNLPGGDLTPERFAREAAEKAEGAGLEVEVLDEVAIEDENLGGIIAVNKGSHHPARLVKLTYTPEVDGDGGEETGTDDLPTVVLVGKGITFDSGGLSLKPPDGMIGMKMDMGGAAAVIGAMCALPAVQAPVRVVSYTPMTDNMTGPDAQRPGDVYTARNGKTVEVLNTDAEGRLVLGEALVLASEQEPDAIIDLATLTGACMVALGDRIAGLMSNDDELRDRIEQAAEAAGERVWRLPLPEDYAKQLESDIADVKNIGTRFGGTLTAGLFLSKFVGEGIPWAHLDIAGPGMGNEAHGIYPKGGTGFGVLTLVQLLSDWSAADAGADSGADGDDSDDDS